MWDKGKRIGVSDTMPTITITSHGKRRAKRRGHIPENKQKAMAQRAFKYGLVADDLSGELKTYLCSKIDGKRDRVYRIYGQKIYVISTDHTLITILNIPKHLIKEADNLCAKKRQRILEEEKLKAQERLQSPPQYRKATYYKSKKTSKRSIVDEQTMFYINRYKILNKVVLLIPGSEDDTRKLEEIREKFNRLGVQTIPFITQSLPYTEFAGTEQQYKEYYRSSFINYLHSLNQSTHVLVVNTSDEDVDNYIPENDIDTQALIKMHTAYLYNKPIYILNNIPTDLEYYSNIVGEITGILGGKELDFFKAV